MPGRRVLSSAKVSAQKALKVFENSAKLGATMIRVFYKEHKGKYDIIAVADHQKDLNNLRLMSYSLFQKDKLTLNKDEFGGPYLKIAATDFQNEEGVTDVEALKTYVQELNERYN